MLPFFLFIHLLFASSCLGDQAEAALRAARELDLANEPTWKALLHHARGKCFVDDATYYLSTSQCSLSDELNALVKAAFSDDSSLRYDIACRFPARTIFLRERLATRGILVPEATCTEFSEYTQRAPADSISLVFAAENITHPMSMMGHVFLKFSGKTSSGIVLEHSASFFTRFSALNVPAVVLDGLFLGMPAFFALAPYSEQIHGYRTLEGRNIFEYPLAATHIQKALIHAHVWELRTIKSPYLFVGYNCATVVYFLVSLANPALLDDLGPWISPIDVVRKTKERRIIRSRHFIPSLDWQIRFFAQQIGSEAATDVITTLQSGSSEQIQALAHDEYEPLRRALAEALIERERQTPRFLDGNTEEVYKTFLEQSLQSTPELEVENLKDPTSGPRSSRFTLGATRFNGASYSKVEVLPASHSLSDDNARSYSESSLELGEASILINPDERREVVVEKINLYAMESLVPYDRYIGGTSSRLIVGAQQEWDGSLSPYTAGHITVGLGKSALLSRDFSVYALANGASSYGDGRFMLSYFPELGAMLYEILSMKTIANYRLVCGQHGSKSCYQSANITQSLFVSDYLSPYFSFSNLWSDDQSAQVYEAGLKLYF